MSKQDLEASFLQRAGPGHDGRKPILQGPRESSQENYFQGEPPLSQPCNSPIRASHYGYFWENPDCNQSQPFVVKEKGDTIHGTS